MKTLLFLCLLIPASVFSQTEKSDSIWIPFNFFIGEWAGTGSGESGNGIYERSYSMIFNGRYIEIHNKSTYPPSSNHQKGEIHQDLGYISYDKIRKTFVLRQFHIEGFVNQYILDSISPDKKTIIFITESIENIPSGWRAKETYHLIDDTEFEEIFELSEPEGDFIPYSTARFNRKQ